MGKNRVDRALFAVTQMVGVYRFGQPRDTEPAFYITLREAQWWWTIGAASLGEAPGSRTGRNRILVLSKPTTDRLQLRSSLGASLTFRYLRGEEEAVSLVHSYAPMGYEARV